MKTAVLACKTLEDEVYYAENIVKSGCDIYTVESEHNRPDKFRISIQKELDRLEDYNRILLVFGICGNATIGLKTSSYELIIPRVDDCISLMIGSVKKREEIIREHQTIFLTQGWLNGKENIEQEYNHALEKYGDGTAKEIMDMMYAHHEMLSIIDTNAYDLDMITARSKKLAQLFGLDFSIIKGTTSYIEQLLSGLWDNDMFVTVPAHSIVSVDMFGVVGNKL